MVAQVPDEEDLRSRVGEGEHGRGTVDVEDALVDGVGAGDGHEVGGESTWEGGKVSSP